ncbi:hypothetical protein UlMin_027352 [Ulmus minor]
MGTVKKRVLRKGASNAEKIDDSVTKKSPHLPPGALQEILAEKKRKVTSKAGVVEDIIGGSKHDQDPPSASLPRRKRSVRCHAASAKIVMDSPPSMSTRSGRGLLLAEATPEEQGDDNANSHGRAASKTRRSLWDSEAEDDMTPPQDPAAVTEEEGEYGLNSPPQSNLPSASRAVKGKSPQPKVIRTPTKGSPAANTRSNHQQTMEIEKSPDPLQQKSPTTATDKVIKTRRKRGPTKLKGIALQNDGPITVRFNCNLQAVGEGSVSLSSFLGPLVREIVPYTISDWRKVPQKMKDVLWSTIQTRYKLDTDWQKDWCMKEMCELWRSSKSRLVTRLNKLPNEEERLKLKPDNIKLEAEWKAFVREKTSKKFQEISKKFKEIRKKQLPHTSSRRGYARIMDDMTRESSKPITRVEAFVKTHTKKNGEPVTAKAAEVLEKLRELANEKPDSCTTNNTVDDALTIIFGPDKPGRCLDNGRGVTTTKLATLRARDDHIARMEAEQLGLKNQMTQVLSLLKNMTNTSTIPGFTAASEGQSHIPVPSPKNNACNLLDWTGSGEIVAEGRWSSSDPDCLVHHLHLGPHAMRVWVDVVKKPGVYLWRPTSDMATIEEAIGTTIAWPADKVLMSK